MSSPHTVPSRFASLKPCATPIAAAALLAFAPLALYAQHGGHVGGGGHVSAPSHASAPPPVHSAPPRPAARPPVAVAPPRAQSSVVMHPAPTVFAPPNSASNSVRPGDTSSTSSFAAPQSVTTVGFPRADVFPRYVRPSTPQSSTTFYGDGHSLWVTSAARPVATARPAFGPIYRGPRRAWPLPGRGFPVYYPIFYPIGFFGGYPGYGFGFEACDPFWGWNFGCAGFGYSNYFGDGFAPTLSYDGPSEPDYVPVPSDGNTNGEQDEAVLYLKDGTVYLISDYWLADNRIHYVTSDGAEHTIDLDEVDLQKSVDVNAKRGVTFTLRPAPSTGDGADGNSPSLSPNGTVGVNPQP
jgi:hypothetical protein